MFVLQVKNTLQGQKRQNNICLLNQKCFTKNSNKLTRLKKDWKKSANNIENSIPQIGTNPSNNH